MIVLCFTEWVWSVAGGCERYTAVRPHVLYLGSPGTEGQKRKRLIMPTFRCAPELAPRCGPQLA